VSWGFYIGNFHVPRRRRAAVVISHPRVRLSLEADQRLAVLGGVLAISALTMCMLFVTIDVGS
jgi:molybdopterin-containing oxidoreductase family membrane subunit